MKFLKVYRRVFYKVVVRIVFLVPGFLCRNPSPRAAIQRGTVSQILGFGWFSIFKTRLYQVLLRLSDKGF